jgi:hypothetical protein
MVTRTRTVIVRNMCQCASCLDIIESTSRHNFVSCGCGAIFTDGGKSYIRRGGKDLANIIDLSETYEEDYESEW